MSRICELSKKKAMNGNNISHSNNKSKRKFKINLFKKKFFIEEENKWIKLKICTSTLRIINKLGIKKALKKFNYKY